MTDLAAQSLCPKARATGEVCHPGGHTTRTYIVVVASKKETARTPCVHFSAVPEFLLHGLAGPK